MKRKRSLLFWAGGWAAEKPWLLLFVGGVLILVQPLLFPDTSDACHSVAEFVALVYWVLWLHARNRRRDGEDGQ